jgi:hypothetical protein
LPQSHRKGAVDGISGTIKWIVWNNILAGKWVSTAEDFADADVAAENNQNIKVAFVSQEMNKFRKDLSERGSNIHTLPDTHNTHYLKPVTITLLNIVSTFFYTAKIFHFKENSLTNDVKDEDTQKSNIPHDENMPKDILTVGQFLLVEWKGKNR